jgi:hypothetical protein
MLHLERPITLQHPTIWLQIFHLDRKKTVLDAWNSYHSLMLNPKASDATTFITEYGKYRYLRAPQGFHASGDGYTKRMDDIVAEANQYRKCIDDSLLYDSTLEDNFWHTMQYIQLCAENGIVFNPSKFHFGLDVVDFAGFELGVDGYSPTRKMLESIASFPTPRNTTGMKSWFGLVNQVSYSFARSSIMAPFRDSLKKGRIFYWDESLNQLFLESKEKIVQLVKDGVKSFEVGRPTMLTPDWSKDGVGFLLEQKHCDCTMDEAPHCGPYHWKLVNAVSRFLTDSETRFAPVEGEAAALVYALESNRMFVLDVLT